MNQKRQIKLGGKSDNLISINIKKIIIMIVIGLSCSLFLGLNFNQNKVKANLVTQTNQVTNLVTNLTPNSDSAILIELSTKKILYEENAHNRLSPASMTKMMTLKLIFDALASGKIKSDQLVVTSQHAASKGGTQIFLSVGEKMVVTDLIKSVAIASANDAAVALAEVIAGSEELFVEKMNQEIANLKLENTHFSNATGLPTENHYSSAYDMAMIAQSLLSTHGEEVLKYTSLYEDYVRQDTINRFWLVNTNKLVKHVEGVDGLKTGWTSDAGYCITTTKQVDQMRLISVVMGCESPTLRTKDTVALLNYGFANFKKVAVRSQGEVIEVSENLTFDPPQVKIVLKEDFSLVIGINQPIPEFTYQVEIDHAKITNLVADDVGVLNVYENEQLIAQIPLVLEKELVKTSWVETVLRIIKMMLG